jgi:hypothetical protein
MEPTENSSQSSDALLSYLEQRTGRSLRSRRAIDDYVGAIAPTASGSAAILRDQSVRVTAGMSVLALMFLFYYFMDVGLQISSLHSAVLTPATISSPLDHRQDRGERAQSTGEATIFT